jgi:uncharacterized repeat protein (TIGR01451 family)
MTGGGAVNNLPAGRVPIFRFSDAIDRFDNNSYVIVTNTSSSMLTNGRIFITTNITASPVTWTQIGAATSPVGACGVQATGPAANPTFYVHAGRCNGDGEGTLWRYTGTAPGGAWQQVNPPGNAGGFGIITADPNNPNRIFASHLNGSNVNMVLSTNGGMNWTVLAQLDNLMTGGGEYKYRNSRGLTINEGNAVTDFLGYPQPSFVAFDPADGNTMIAGGADSGIFLSRDGGNVWHIITDNSGGSSNPHLPRPRFAYFDHEGGNINIYIGTQGRGVWRASFQDQVANLAITKTASPNPVVTGSNITYTINVSNGGPGNAQSVIVNDTLPPQTSFISCQVAGGAGGACGGAGNNRTVTFTSLAANASATITLIAQISCSVVDGAMISNSATVGSLASDPNLSNNTSMATVTASNPPPVITCPPDQNVATALPGQMSVVVNYPPPTVLDNCPGVVVNCSPPSGSSFPLGVTTVTCTATDSGGRNAMCGFKVTVFDVCIEDDKSGDFLLFNSFTGDYLFTRCGPDGFTMSGRGRVTRVGCSTKLEDDTRVVFAEIVRCLFGTENRGSARIKRIVIGTTFILEDSYILNNTCDCS